MAASGRRPILSWRDWRTRGIMIPLGLMLLLAGLTIYLEIHEREAFVQSRSLVIHSHEVIEAAQTLFSQVQDAETGQRGYLLTHDDASLEPYKRAVAVLPGSMASLREQVKGDDGQGARVDQLLITVRAKLDELGRTVALARSERSDQAR